MFHEWDPGSIGKFWDCKELYLNEQIGRLWKQDGLLVIRINGDLEILFGPDLVSTEIGIAEIRLRKERSKAVETLDLGIDAIRQSGKSDSEDQWVSREYQ
ncbi:BnaAnng26350D [Brassica napus]|uniref:BnaAnng26350D protein n=2 Tax=Brassica TaxID=3705 RepID=A0A078JNX9_BRANA|nr:BnaAnng26350D [Brassica napus]VDC96019.1 unnamed protein product [Brassica oleracea]